MRKSKFRYALQLESIESRLVMSHAAAAPAIGGAVDALTANHQIVAVPQSEIADSVIIKDCTASPIHVTAKLKVGSSVEVLQKTLKSGVSHTFTFPRRSKNPIEIMVKGSNDGSTAVEATHLTLPKPFGGPYCGVGFTVKAGETGAGYYVSPEA